VNKLIPLFAFSILLLVPASQNAFAELITFEFEIEVTDVFEVGVITFPVPDVEIGDIITGSYTFDSEAIGIPFSSVTAYPFEEVRVNVDGLIMIGVPPLDPAQDGIFVGDAPGFYNLNEDLFSDDRGGHFFFVLEDFDDTVFADESLPLIPPNLDEFEFNDVDLAIAEVPQVQFGFLGIDGKLISLTLQQQIGGDILPIDTLALLLLGFQSTTWLLPVVLSVIGIGIFVVSRKSKNS